MIIDIPIKNPYSQINKDDVSGSINETFNVDFGFNKLSLPNKTVISTDTSDLTELGLISKFVFFEGKYVAYSVGTDSGTYGSDARLFRGGDAVDDGFTLPEWTVNTTDYPTEATVVSFGGKLILIGDDTWSLSTDTDTSWTSESTSGSGASKFSLVFEDRAYYISGSSIRSFADPATHASSGAYTWTLPNGASQDFSGLDKSTAGIWVAASSREGSEAYVYLWDGQTENAYDGEYKVPDSSIMALKVHEDVPYVVLGNGIIMRFNGSFFEEINRFPFTEILLARRQDFSIDIGTTSQGKWIHPMGVDIINNKLHFLVNPIAEDDSTIFGDYSKLAGIWCLDPNIGLYHRYAISITVNNGEVGQLKHVGALKAVAFEQNVSPAELGSFLFSVSYYTENSTSTEEYAIGYAEPIGITGATSNGYMTTQRIYSNELSDTWEKVAIGFEELDSTDSIEFKYRTKELEGNNIGVTWASATSFTSSSTNLMKVKTNFEAGNNYECRVLLGNGSGIISQITDISETGGTYTITLDTAHDGVSASDTGQVRLENWESVETITSSDNEAQIKNIPIGKQSNWIQYKLVLRGSENARNEHNPVINRIVSVSTPHTKHQ